MVRLLKRSGIPALLLAAASMLLAWLPEVLTSSERWPGEVLVAVEVQMFVVTAFLVIVRRHWRVAIAILLLSPFHYRFWKGAYGYARGAAYYWYRGKCRGESGNLDPELRVPLICRQGRTFPDVEWALWYAPQNAGVRLCSAVIGSMPGAYDGPLPTSDDIREVVRESQSDVALATVRNGAIPVGDTVVKVRPDFGPRMIEAEFGQLPEEACLSTMTARVALWRDRVLVVAMPSPVNCTGGVALAVPRDWLSFAAALDTRSGRVLGYYRLGLFPNADLAGVWQLKDYDSSD